MTFPNSALPYSSLVKFIGDISTIPSGPTMLKITQQEFAHDVVEMLWWGGDVNAAPLLSGMPLEITFGNPTVKREFYGYVNHAGRINNYMPGMAMESRNGVSVVGIGASWQMKNVGQQVWYNATVSQVLHAVAAKFGLATDITNHNTVWPVLQMAGQSYWQFCVSLAHRVGYTFYCNGVQLVFKPRQTNPANLTFLADSFDLRADPAGMPVFTPQIGATSPSGGQLKNRQMAGINPRTNQPFYSQVSGAATATSLGPVVDAPLFTETLHSTADSQEESDVRTSGTGLTNQLYVTATATAIGNPLVSQGSLIYIQNGNGSQNGLWFVQKCEHVMDKVRYVMNLTLGRDSRGATSAITTLPRVATQPVAALRGGAWMS